MNACRTAVACCLLAAAPAVAAAQTNDQIAPVAEDPQGLLDLLVEIGDPAQCFEEPALTGVDLAEAAAEPPGARVEPRRVVVALDASGSMAGRAGGELKMDAARAAVADFLAGLPSDVEVGLVAFGHHGDNTEQGRAVSCAGVDLMVPLSTDPAPVTEAMQGLAATGWTPLATAIETAGQAFDASEVEGEQAVFVVSDGVETCDGNPVAAAQALVDSDVRAVVNIIGFDLAADDRAALAAVAEAGRGAFAEAEDREALIDALNAQAAERARTADNLAAVRAAIADNNAAARTAIANANACVRTMIANERASFRTARSNITARDRGLVPAAVWGAASDILDGHHDVAREAMTAFRNGVEEAREARRAEIEGSLDAVSQ